MQCLEEQFIKNLKSFREIYELAFWWEALENILKAI